ncbi:carboxypeptidase A4-like [Thrips palmi]|uniref:Carboxypeptidase A4-like n=1 Tax=Thrips palmi TaxID=161013 RepID=A0A6P8YXG9_THRPL|nr:carboxypeptidase A4-like [Thrips palmi]XP_034244851.1 carboxypeptidase A4-like [Thrips palmi]
MRCGGAPFRAMVVRAALVLAVLGACASRCACSPWNQDDVDRLRAWQERQDERLLMQQRGLEERQRLHDDLLLERLYQQTDGQLHRERQHDERQTERDERLNDHQRLRDDLQQDRQTEQSERQGHFQDIRDQHLDEHQQLHDELASDREREVEDLRRQREQLTDQTRRDRERTDREREREQQRREREQHRREQEREQEQRRVERERDLRDQRRRWRRDADAANATATDAVKSYEGSQLWRVQASEGDVANLQSLETNGVAQVWYSNATVWDLLVAAENQPHVSKLLADNKLAYTVVIADLQRAIAEENPALSEEELELTGRKGHRMTWQHYHRAADMAGWVDYLAKTYPDTCEAMVIGNSLEGRPLKVLHIKGKAGSPAMWIDGGIHAREWITSASVSYMVNELCENRDAYSSWLDKVDLYVLPLANPDGYEYSHQSDRMWRKNRRRGGGCDGIDLNRNFGYKWGGKGASPQPCQEIFRGSAAFSEPETNAIQNFVLSKKGSLKSYLSFHSYGQYVLYPWGYDRFVPPDHQDLQRVGTKMANAMRATSGLPYTVGSSAALLYPASGGSDDWAKGVAGMKYAFTIELRDTGRHGFVLPSSHILSSGKEVMAAVRTLAQEVALL